jgi:ketosteroid isomerase-like protein
MDISNPTDVFSQWIACAVAGDLAGWTSHATADLVYTHSSGLYETRDEVLAAFNAGRRYIAIDTEEMEQRVYAGAAIVTGIAHIQADRPSGERVALDVRFTTTLVTDEDTWRVAAWQSVPLPT